MILDNIDRALILATQSGLPLMPQPYQTLAKPLNISAEEVMQRMSVMQEKGVIRRIGVVPNHYRLGYTFNGMTVWNIVDEYIDQMGEKVGQLDFVSHCYHRPRHEPEWCYNLFAMVHSRTEADVNHQIQIIAELLGDYSVGHEVLYSTKILKKTGLRTRRADV
jgi:DNA-binding Lrp family transcriptional regulator